MFAKFYSLEWKKSDKAEFVIRKPGEKRPTSNCLEHKRNPDGSIVYMIPKKSQYILTVQAENGELFSEDVYGIIKYYKYNARITKNFREKFESFMRTREYEIDEHDFIRGMYPGIEEFIRTNP